MKDVGNIFENKLDKGEKKPSENVWEKINTSLDSEQLRKKRILYNWVVGAGILSVLVLFLVFNYENISQSNSAAPQDNIPIKIHSNNSSESSTKRAGEEKELKEAFKISLEDTSEEKDNIEKNSSDLEKSNRNSELSAKENYKKTQSQSTKKSSENKPEFSGSGTQSENKNFTVSKNYYYYDSKTGKTLVTQSKNKIDSLIAERHIPLDSVNTHEINKLEE